MRVLRLTFALWWDPNWSRHLRRSWRKRRYWLTRPQSPSVHGRALALQFGPLTLKWTAEGRKDKDKPNG